jgi:tRNA-dihydrouridine synthase A
MLPYIEYQVAKGLKLNSISRHFLQIFASQPGTKAWKRHIRTYGHLPGASAQIIAEALDKVPLT